MSARGGGAAAARRVPEGEGEGDGDGATRDADPILQLLGRPDGPLAGASLWALEVAHVQPLTPRMRRVELTGPDLGALAPRPGQDLMLRMPAGDGERRVNRRYTIRSFDALAPVVVLDAVLHGDGPAARWFAAAAPGDRIEAIGPRGNVTPVDGCDWHLFVGDESAVPGMLAMAESRPAGARAIVVAEVADAAEEQPVAPGAPIEVRWLHRDGTEPGRARVLLDAVAGWEPPAGPGHAYVAGEARTVAALRRTLVERGLAADRISAKAYWSAGRANAVHGEPERDRE